MEAIRWGILGTGNIASVFAKGLTFLSDAQLVAVGSRAAESAQRFAERFDVPRAHDSYEALANDPDVDIVYVSTPHSLHYDNTMLCLRAGKAVLCEKPFAINAREAAEMIATARERKLFLMEAMWTRFLPSMVRMRELLAERVIGDLRMLQADFGFRANFNPQSRLFDPALGGGGLMDVGVYCVSLASQLFGMPDRMVGLAETGTTGVDEQGAAILGYPSGQLAVLSTAIRTTTPHEATLMGTEGLIRLPSSWWKGTGLTVMRNDQPPETINLQFEGNGYNYEAAEAGRCLRAGKLESEIMPLDETLAIMQTLDQIRVQWGVRYPGE